jgi:hypothetical protein
VGIIAESTFLNFTLAGAVPCSTPEVTPIFRGSFRGPRTLSFPTARGGFGRPVEFDKFGQSSTEFNSFRQLRRNQQGHPEDAPGETERQRLGVSGPTKSGNIEPSSLKKEHIKAIAHALYRQ